MMRTAALTGLLLLAACSKTPAGDDAASTPAAGETKVAAAAEHPGKAAFGRCVACHSVNKGGANGMGPNLHGVFGRKVASAEGFTYSAGMKAKGGVWDDAALDALIADPRKAVPGTRMVMPPVTDAAQRQLIISYLKDAK